MILVVLYFAVPAPCSVLSSASVAVPSSTFGCLCARKPKALIIEGRIFCDKRENENRSQAKNIDKQEPSNIGKLEGRHNISTRRQKIPRMSTENSSNNKQQ
jgi:hypothetical protein